MLPFFICLILACIITFFILKITSFFSYKSQAENFKNAAYIYLRKKVDFMPELINMIIMEIGETDEIIEIIKLRNDFKDDSKVVNSRNFIHECNRILGIILQKNSNLLSNNDIIELRNTWYSLDADFNSNISLYLSSASSYNNMLANDFICSKIGKILGYEEEQI